MPAIRRNKLMETVWAAHRAVFKATGGRIGVCRRFEEIEKGYAVYKERTNRRIPVVLLEQVGGG